MQTQTIKEQIESYSFTNSEIILMINISYLDNKKDYKLKDFSTLSNIRMTDRRFYKVINILIKHECLSVKYAFDNGFRIVRINTKKLRDFIDELPEVNFYYKYFYTHHYIQW